MRETRPVARKQLLAMLRDDLVIFRQALGRHKERASEPIGQDDRSWRQARWVDHRPVDHQADRIVDRFRDVDMHHRRAASLVNRRWARLWPTSPTQGMASVSSKPTVASRLIHPSQYLAPGPLRPATSAGFAKLHRSIDRQPQPMHSPSPDRRRCNSAMRWSIRFAHALDSRDQSRRDGTRSAGSLASSAPISSSVSPIRCAKTMKAIRRNADRW